MFSIWICVFCSDTKGRPRERSRRDEPEVEPKRTEQDPLEAKMEAMAADEDDDAEEEEESGDSESDSDDSSSGKDPNTSIAMKFLHLHCGHKFILAYF